ncbi:putative lysine-specific demethylase 2A isoform X1 [Sesbania bispinosa]|nr:putative lysine-specific demethylase 2A isoform X1 [Sesbania bispinosa]
MSTLCQVEDGKWGHVQADYLVTCEPGEEKLEPPPMNPLPFKEIINVEPEPTSTYVRANTDATKEDT